LASTELISWRRLRFLSLAEKSSTHAYAMKDRLPLIKITISYKKIRGNLIVNRRGEAPMQTTMQASQQMTRQSTVMQDMKVKLSTLWLFAVLNYVYCDVVTLMNPAYVNGLVAGNAGGIQVTPGFLLEAGILVEIPIAMVLLSRVLGHRGNRWANIVAGSIMTVVQAASLFLATPGLYYVFFSIIEITATLVIVWYAWKWPAFSNARALVTPQAPSSV
jgi:hypothetical protein